MAVTSNSPREYQLARRVLLDALDALREHVDSLVLVGAQAIYLQAGDISNGQPQSTTDADLVIDPELLATEPDIAQSLTGHGFVETKSIGTWTSHDGIAVDLMVPMGGASKSHRHARLEGHSSSTARRTKGLELAIHSFSEIEIAALELGDDRHQMLKVASPASLLIAKLIKLEERAIAGNQSRIEAKDAADVLLILRSFDLLAVGSELKRLGASGVDYGVINQALAYLRAQTVGQRSELIELAVSYSDARESPQTISISFEALAARLLSRAAIDFEV